MTSYNHEHYIAEAIESVLTQTYKDFELIIVDDASKDRSREIICEYQRKDTRIYSIFHRGNQGISKTTNDGFAAAKGDCVAYIQSDDLWRPDKLEIQLKAFAEYPSSIIWSDAVIIDGRGNPRGQLFTERYKAVHKPKTGNLFPYLLKDNYICGQSLLFDRKVIDTLSFDPKLIFANDYKFMIQLSLQYEFYFIEEPLVKYRIHDTNSIHTHRDLWQRDTFLISKYLLDRFGETIPIDIRAKLYSRMGHYLYTRKHYRYAYRSYRRAIEMCPGKTTYGKHYLTAYWRSLVR